jgi:hypothetical protein
VDPGAAIRSQIWRIRFHGRRALHCTWRSVRVTWFKIDGVDAGGIAVPVPYDSAHPDLAAVRRIFFDWLRADPNANQINPTGAAYDRFVDYVNNNRQPQVLAFHVTEVFWQLVIEGIVAPGMNSSNQNLPWFHVTAYGKKVLGAEAGHPHDENGYLARVQTRVPKPDATVLAYLSEALTAFRRGTPVASTIMLGIAAERVFLLVCDSLSAALRDPIEKAAFDALMQRLPIKPKLDWVHAKLLDLQNRRSPGLPDNATLAVTAIYDFLRTQRNDLGHPREAPPSADREEAFANLQIFPRYYQVAEELRRFLGANQV